MEGDEFDVKVAETKEEITELLKVGFEWVEQDSNGSTYLAKESKKDAIFFKMYLYLADFASQFFDDFFSCGWFNFQGVKGFGSSEFQFHFFL